MGCWCTRTFDSSTFGKNNLGRAREQPPDWSIQTNAMRFTYRSDTVTMNLAGTLGCAAENNTNDTHPVMGMCSASTKTRNMNLS